MEIGEVEINTLGQKEDDVVRKGVRPMDGIVRQIGSTIR
eukprot:CAMPEP_0174265518 /NCGR_PEP_ID=MMETSP0439-20130205/26803_1 /TAXON_ID=0 /ORGANISM="Stereomyxa ramosa, Strain Chinc5" /LENGTH=38 /DNA_ID= /DNA_START= /DNA_END= /DNA_ORIENTATION=